MQARKRYLLLLISTAFILFAYYAFFWSRWPPPSSIPPFPWSGDPPRHQNGYLKDHDRSPSQSDNEDGKVLSKQSSRRRAASYLDYNYEEVINSKPPSNLIRNAAQRHRDSESQDPMHNPPISSKNPSSRGRTSPSFTGRSKMVRDCRLISDCFDFSKCKPGQDLKIHIYQDNPSYWRNIEPEGVHFHYQGPGSSEKGPIHDPDSVYFSISTTYQKILDVIRNSIHYEPDPNRACLFMTSFDTLDRDTLSPDFEKNLPKHVFRDSGRNHLMFNLYSGSWPTYHELDFAGLDPGFAILVKASLSHSNYRPGFDVSLPLFSKLHPTYGYNAVGRNYIKPNSHQNQQDQPQDPTNQQPLEYNFGGQKNLLVFKVRLA